MDKVTLPLQDIVTSRIVEPGVPPAPELTSLEHFFHLVHAVHQQSDVEQGGWCPDYLRPTSTLQQSSVSADTAAAAASSVDGHSSAQNSVVLSAEQNQKDIHECESSFYNAAFFANI